MTAHMRLASGEWHQENRNVSLLVSRTFICAHSVNAYERIRNQIKNKISVFSHMAWFLVLNASTTSYPIIRELQSASLSSQVMQKLHTI
ncbi:hypothetical protein GDO78_008850 [Eleutherodactylus coqui]|uniref:Uncharacterized protein n=1 Tax=Eleutherodactylus coqui TaxID=57060 RepID=A0A8J6K9R4_ELECQ|nr:hypothetical protein GDO78_008850 [Eleutherodactylus coqui]